MRRTMDRRNRQRQFKVPAYIFGGLLLASAAAATAPMQCANKLQSHNNKTHNKCSLVCVACDFMKYFIALEVNRL